MKKKIAGRALSAPPVAIGGGKGNPIRQDYLEKVLAWIADRDGLASGQLYMAAHQHDADANDLWLYFREVIDWARRLFPSKCRGITDVQEWGILYNKYYGMQYNSNMLEADMKRLLADDDVTKSAGIVPYLLSPRSSRDERYLSIRIFTESQKRRAYEHQNGLCAKCGEHFAFEEMQGDHIRPWCQGGRTVDDNLQMLCRVCNNDKGGD